MLCDITLIVGYVFMYVHEKLTSFLIGLPARSVMFCISGMNTDKGLFSSLPTLIFDCTSNEISYIFETSIVFTRLAFNSLE